MRVNYYVPTRVFDVDFVDFISSGRDCDGSNTSGISTCNDISTFKRSSSTRTATSPPRKTLTIDPLAMGRPAVAVASDDDDTADPRAVFVIMLLVY